MARTNKAPREKVTLLVPHTHAGEDKTKGEEIEVIVL
jgi:hypothetical protein